ncbi:hypothetical protein QVD17_39112 [Tagetes erecta]|uniref:DUF3741 domain-containing protein n=1 Tax=Tagetes erecta TaxID=13708 RepID=A0AAD8JPN0_TARER|nr:hypothetical protein QVD17_39112 [Tagetes erecta]
MAAKSDFAQKLLLDLRLRKERMGASQGSTRNHSMARDAYRDAGNMNRGSRQHKSHNSIGGSKSIQISPTETSQQIVSYTGKHHRRSESAGDLSMAFTFKNGGKLMNMDLSTTNTMIDFLNQIGRRSLQNSRTGTGTRTGTITSLVKHRPSSAGGAVVVPPALTTIQIKEISKGVQNLYEIIRSSSDAANVSRYSMEVGKELLKGAKGLEESLRMLVDLQEASEMMVNPRRKSRITLLEVDDDDDNVEDERLKKPDRNEVALPRFSFDKPSKKVNIPVAGESGRIQTHQRSVSGDVESVQSVCTVKPTSNRSEKGRISNVIAKLMGLEEIPVKVESNTKQDEIKKGEDLNKNIVKKSSRPVIKDVVSLNDRKPEKVHDSNINVESRMNRSNKNSKEKLDLNRNGEMRTNQSNKNENRSNGESKEKMHSKRRVQEAAVNLQVEKKKTNRSSEIKLVPRNNQTQEPERKTQKSKHDSQQMKLVKNTNSVSKESKPQPFDGNQKVKDSTPKVQEQERTGQKTMPVTRKKVDSIAVVRTESPRTKDEVLKRRNRTINDLSPPSKQKLSACIRSVPEEIITKRPSSVTNANETESITRVYDNVLVCENEPKIDLPLCVNETKSDCQVSSEIVLADNGTIRQQSNVEPKPLVDELRITKNSNRLENRPKKALYSSIQVVLTEQEKQLKEILMKDQLFLSTAEALFKLNIPVGFLHVDDHNRHQNETKLKLDCGYEILKRKARNQELSVHPYVKPSIGDTRIRFLDELVKQLYKDLEGLRLYGRDTRNEYDETDYLHHMLEKDIHSKNPDINSFWDFGWHITTFTFVEKDEFVSDVEQDVFHILVDEIVDDLLSM